MADNTRNDRLLTDGSAPLLRLPKALTKLLKALTPKRGRQLADADLENLPSSLKRDMGWPDRHLFKTKSR